jgi:membrane-bound ClpP family serine protease
MPFAVALLCHPVGAYTCFVTALAAFVYAYHSRRFVPAFTAASAGVLTTLAFAHVTPDAAGVALVAVGVGLLQTELVLPTFGAALLAGCASSLAGAWRLLDGAAIVTQALPTTLRLAIAAAGTLTLLASVLRGFRLRTLRGPH